LRLPEAGDIRWRIITLNMLRFAKYALLLYVAVINAGAQTLSTIVTFDGTNGISPVSPLVQGVDGDLYGVTYTGASYANTFYGTIFKTTTSGVLTTLYAFPSGDANPTGITLDANGVFYGETQEGGTITDSCTLPFCGTIFRMAPGGSPTTLLSFDGSDGTVSSGLVSGADGELYGTSKGGGTNSYGTVFSITPDGSLTTLHDFAGPDGAMPCDGLVLANGLLYGTTLEGGANNDGTVFSITPSGELTTLHSFDGTDGSGACDLLSAKDGGFYGFTTAGGTDNGGTVFRITPAGKLTTVTNFPFRGTPNALTIATDGNLYGTVPYGNSFGSIFELTPAGVLTVLYSFDGTGSINIPTGLVQVTDGSFYGTTGSDGDFFGAIFRLSVGLSPFVKTLPTSGKTGATVKILGTNLARPASLTFNGTVAEVIEVRPSEIIATVPAGATTGPVVVTTPSGTLSSNLPFRVLQ
jgi:uncharacterized repeat protein (TIGR03803 family)